MSEHVLIIHRWTDRYADYAAYLDHATHRVSYVATEPASAHLPLAQSAGTRLVADIEDAKAVRAAVDELAAAVGPFTRIVALHEVDLDIAAELRGERGLPGQSSAQLQPLRDKLAMAERLAAADVPVPATEAAPDKAAIEAFVARHGWPVLVKPRRGTASVGITRLDTAEELAAYELPQETESLVQPWIPHRVLHVDGVFTGSGLGAWRASRYLTTCLDFTGGTPLGSVEIDDPDALGRISELSNRALAALFDAPSVFHLELFESDAGELTVLEVGARPGGAEVPFLWREVHGVDLMAAAFAHQSGTTDVSGVPTDDPSHVAGWLLVPPSATLPCRVRSTDGVPDHGPYAQVRPGPGQLMRGGGYEHVGARFRFRGHSTAEVTAAIERTARSVTLRADPVDKTAEGRLVLIGCGNPPYREYSLASVASRVETALVAPVDLAEWQRPYVGDQHRRTDTTDLDATTAAVAELIAGHPGPAAVLTWDETLLHTTAEVAARLRLPHMSARAVRGCRDKLTMRQLLERGAVPSARFRHVHTERQALDAGTELGYPVVVKPRSLAGSIGVSIAREPEELRGAYEQAAGATFPGVAALDGAIVEEFLDGPEFSVDCAVADGEVTVVNVARKRLGFAPYFEEVGHLVAPWRDEPWADDVVSVVARAHAVLGIRHGLTHTELRLTVSGPRIVEVNGRLGGDFIPLLGRLAIGVDPVAVAAEVALGRTPALEPDRDVCAAVLFVYPEHDGIVQSLDLSAAAAVSGIERAVALSSPGTELRLPPHGIVPRLAALLATGDTPEACTEALRTAAAVVRADVTPSEPSLYQHTPTPDSTI